MSSSFLARASPPECDVSRCVICASTLQDPLLLQCLHSVCQACVGDTAEEITCAICQQATDTSCAKSNVVILSHLHRARILKDIFSCTHCMDEDKPDAAAVAWCYSCQISLCVDYQKYHSKFHPYHKLVPLDEHTNVSDLYRPPVRSCTEHGEELKFACLTCQLGRCFKCAHNCYTSAHDVQPIDGSAAVESLMSRVIAATTSLVSKLKATDILLQAHLSLPATVADAMEVRMGELRNAKKIAIDTIHRAYDKAEESLMECWEVLLSKAENLCASAEFLKKRVDWTIEYCQLALSTEDIAGLLPQLDILSSCVRSLLDEVNQTKPLPDPLKLVSVNTCMPRDLDLIASDWFGRATLVGDNFDSPPSDVTRETNADYYIRRVSTLKELEDLVEKQKEEQKIFERERLRAEQLLEHQKEEQANRQRERHSMEKLVEQQNVEHENLEHQRHALEQLVEQLMVEKTNLQQERNSAKQLLEQCKEELKHFHNERSMEQLLQMQKDEQSNVQRVRQSVEQLLEMQKEEQKSLQRERQSMEQLGIELKLEQQQLAPSAPLRFNDKPRGAFKGPGQCWDVAFTPQGRLLVAATSYGLKEYDATSFREITTWKPDGNLLGKEFSDWVGTVDALADGRAVVGLYSNVIVLLRRETASGGCRAEAWRVERRVAELQAPPRRLSAWGFRLLAVLQDRRNETTNSWCCGPSLVLLSLSDGQQLHRHKLDYDASSVALTDSTVIVSSVNAVELAPNERSSGNFETSYVIDCYSHDGVRLWRHAVSNGLNAMSLCLDSVGRVLYAAKRGSVVALNAEDGRELSTAVRLSAKETESSFAIGLDKATRRLLALISLDGREPNHVAVFSTVRNLLS